MQYALQQDKNYTKAAKAIYYLDHSVDWIGSMCYEGSHSLIENLQSFSDKFYSTRKCTHAVNTRPSLGNQGQVCIIEYLVTHGSKIKGTGFQWQFTICECIAIHNTH